MRREDLTSFRGERYLQRQLISEYRALSETLSLYAAKLELEVMEYGRNLLLVDEAWIRGNDKNLDIPAMKELRKKALNMASLLKLQSNGRLQSDRQNVGLRAHQFLTELEILWCFRNSIHLYTDHQAETSFLNKDTFDRLNSSEMEDFTVDFPSEHHVFVRINKLEGDLNGSVWGLNVTRDIDGTEMATFPVYILPEKLPRLYSGGSNLCSDCQFPCRETSLKGFTFRQMPRVIQEGSARCALQREKDGWLLFPDLLPIINTALESILCFVDRGSKVKTGKRAGRKAATPSADTKVIVSAEKDDVVFVPVSEYRNTGSTGTGTKHTSHASPREHVRRPSVRTYRNPDGSIKKVVQVRGTVVNAGKGNGEIVYKTNIS